MLIDDIYRQLGPDSNPYREHTFNITSDNSIKLLATPNLWGHDPTDNSYWNNRPAAPYYIEELTNTIKEAQTIIDISMLYYLPDGYFLEALKAGFEFLDKSGRKVVVRMLLGWYEPLKSPESEIRNWLNHFSHLHNTPIYVGVNQTNVTCWNHAKIVAVDGRMAIVGGHNMVNDSYMTFAPVHDVTIKVTGSAAHDAHCFLNRLWVSCCQRRKDFPKPTNYAWRLINGHVDSQGLPRIEISAPKGPGTARILSLGRMGMPLFKFYDPKANPSDDARWWAVKSARSSLKLSQQDLGHNVAGFRPYFVAELATALIRGVDVYCVISGDNAQTADGQAYFMLGLLKTAVAVKLAVQLHPRGPKNEPDLLKLLSQKMHLAPLRFTDLPPRKWSGKYKGNECKYLPANHAKVYIVDDKAFYVGSDNAYMHDCQEYGYLVEGEIETKAFLSDYWDKLWLYSKSDEFQEWNKSTSYPALDLLYVALKKIYKEYKDA
jgi:phosphatidylserine/phosphatidylglycerophosphate/cardiolipin synthase-like enzyme